MDATVKNKLQALGRLLIEHNCEDTIVLDISGQNSWTEGFIIATVTSQGHLRGVVRHLREGLEALEAPVYHGSKNMEEEGWTLVDCGDFVIHLMNRETRDFYELEKLWHFGKVIPCQV